MAPAGQPWGRAGWQHHEMCSASAPQQHSILTSMLSRKHAREHLMGNIFAPDYVVIAECIIIFFAFYSCFLKFPSKIFWRFINLIIFCFNFRFLVIYFILIQFGAEADQVLECNYAGRSGGCEVRIADLSKKTVNEKFTFTGTQEQNKIATGIRFQESGRVAHLPQNLAEEFPKLTDLSIRWSEVPIVRNSMFGPQFSWIKELYLGENNIQIIEDGAFKHLPNLEEVSLFDNKIQSLGAKVFENNSKLKVIWLHDNKINMISPETCRHLNQLKSVDFEGNECFSKPIGCWNCHANIGHTELNSNLLPCYENHKKSLYLLNEGENILGLD